MIPAGQLFHRMQRLVRDLGQQTHKDFDFTMQGDDIEMDKVLLDQLSDPLIHLIRNAVDHGLEEPQERAKTGKPARGLIQLRAEQRGREILIVVQDDGRGLDRKAIIQKARSQGLIGADEEPDDQSLWKVILLPGFSTSKEISTLSGRGVGMDVVHNAIRALHGKILIDTHPGRGTCITLVIPLTLAFLDCLVVRSANRFYAIPIDVVSEVFSPVDHQVFHSSAEGADMARWHGAIVPVSRFSEMYQEAQDDTDPVSRDHIIVVVEVASGQFGIPVEEIIGQQQVVLKPLKGILQNIRGGAGCALLSSGEVAIALDLDHLFEKAGRS